MCRWMAWLGQPLALEELLFNTDHGIVDQTLHARMGAERTAITVRPGGVLERRAFRPRTTELVDAADVS